MRDGPESGCGARSRAGSHIAGKDYGRDHAGCDQTGKVPLVVYMVNLIAAQQLALVVGIVGNESGTAVGRMQGLLQEIEGIDRVVVSSENKGVLDIIVRHGRKGQGTVDICQQNPHHYQQEEGKNHVQNSKHQGPVAADERQSGILYQNIKRTHGQYPLDDGCERYAPHLPHGGVAHYPSVTFCQREGYE